MSDSIPLQLQAPRAVVKGVLLLRGEVLLLQNERDEWELPGGGVDYDDPSPEHALRREFREETGLAVDVGPIVDSWMYHPEPDARHSLIVTYRCRLTGDDDSVVISHEHSASATFALDRLDTIALPGGYAASIRRAMA